MPANCMPINKDTVKHRKMNVIIATFTNPFSFHCVKKDSAYGHNFRFEHSANASIPSKTEWSDVNHGQYLAVWHNNKWTRGVVSMETQVLIWLVDCGYYLRPEETTIYVELSAEYKKLPSKVFEASIHGVIPVDRIMNDKCEIENQVSTFWNNGAIQKGASILNSCVATYFVPIAILSTKGNDVVLGDLYMETPDGCIVNFVEQMEAWPIFLEKSPIAYIKNLAQFYPTRRKHHACLLKPQMVPNTELPTVTTNTSLAAYQTIIDNTPKLEFEVDSNSGDGSTVVDCAAHRKLHLTPSEIEEYSNMYIKVNGREYNVLNVITNKTRDLIMCEKYKDRNSVGRATSRTRLMNKFSSREEEILQWLSSQPQ